MDNFTAVLFFFVAILCSRKTNTHRRPSNFIKLISDCCKKNCSTTFMSNLCTQPYAPIRRSVLYSVKYCSCAHAVSGRIYSIRRAASIDATGEKDSYFWKTLCRCVSWGLFSFTWIARTNRVFEVYQQTQKPDLEFVLNRLEMSATLSHVQLNSIMLLLCKQFSNCRHNYVVQPFHCIQAVLRSNCHIYVRCFL